MTRKDWIEKLRLFKETGERYHAASQEREKPESLAVIESFHTLLVELVANLGLFSAEDQAFIVKANLDDKLRRFREISVKYDTFLQGRENPDDDLSVVGNSFNSLLSELLSNLNLFELEEGAYIENAKKRTYIPQIRRRLSRARDRANSRSRSDSRSTPPSSTESSFASTSETSGNMGDPAAAAAELAAAQEKEKKMARVLQLKLDLEAARRKAAMVKLESQEKQAEVIQAAINEGLASSLAEVIAVLLRLPFFLLRRRSLSNPDNQEP